MIKLSLIRKNRDVIVGDPYEPQPYQLDIHRSQAVFNTMIGAPGSGKTIVGAMEIRLHIAKRHGNVLLIVPNYNHYSGVVAPEYERWFPKSIVVPRGNQPHEVRIGRGRVWFVRSAEKPAGIDGLNNVTTIVIEEPQNMRPDSKILDKVKERLYRQRTGLAKAERPRVVIVGMSLLENGTSWVLEQLINPALNGDPEYYYRRAPLSENTRIPQSEKEKIYAANPPGTWLYDRYEGIYRPDPEGMVFPELPDHGQPYLKYGLLESDEIGFAADLSRGRDPFVFGVFGRKGKTWTLFDEYRNTTGGNEKVIAAEIRALLMKLGILDLVKLRKFWFVHDHDGGIFTGNLNEELEKHGIHLHFMPAIKGQVSVEPSLRFMRDLFITRRLQIDMAAKSTYYELASYKWKKGDVHEPEHEFSHGPDMVRYWVWTHGLVRGYASQYK
jgi:hypothetical protein